MSVLESIVRDLQALPPPRLMDVARYVRGLQQQHRRRDALSATAGCLSGEEGEEFERAVRDEADRVDADSR